MPHFFQPFSMIVPWVPEVFIAQFPVSVTSLSIKTAEAQVAKLATCIFLFSRVPSTYLKQWLAFRKNAHGTFIYLFIYLPILGHLYKSFIEIYVNESYLISTVGIGTWNKTYVKLVVKRGKVSNS